MSRIHTADGTTDDRPGPHWWYTQELERNLHVGFTTIDAGNFAHHVGPQDEVDRNRADLERRMGVSVGSLRFMHQTHSAQVARAGEHGAVSTVLEADASVSADGSHALAVMTADCLPVIFHGTRTHDVERWGHDVTAVAHAGCPGLLAGILQNTVNAVRGAGAEKITAWIGPGACGQCYEIPQRMVDEIAAQRPAIRSVTRWGTSALDLRAEAESILARLNVRIAAVRGCTIEDHSLFSHRRDPGRGRLAGVIWRQPGADRR